MSPDELQKHRTYLEENREARRAYNREYNAKWCKENPEKYNAIMSRYRKKLKSDAFDAYGGPVCKMCGEDNIDKLSLDHSFKDGREHRDKISNGVSVKSGWRFYGWLKRNNYPQDLGLRVLCMSCNVKEGPHSGGPQDRTKDSPFRDKDWLYNEYVTKNRSLDEIGDECGVSNVTVMNQLKAFGIPRRKGRRKTRDLYE